MRLTMLLLAVGVVYAQSQSPSMDCSSEASLASPPSQQLSSIDFVNRTGATVQVHWRNESRHRYLIRSLAPNEGLSQNAPAGQPFVVTDMSGRCLSVYQAGAAPALASITANSPAAIASGSIIQTFAGTNWIFPGDGPAASAPLGLPSSVAVDSQGNILIADRSNFMIYRITRDGILHVFAGNGIEGNSGDGGPARNASLGDIDAVAVAPDGTVYIAEFGGFIKRVTPDGIMHLFVDLKLSGGPAIGEGGQAIAVDQSGNVYYADFINNIVRKITPSATVTTVAGNGQAGFSGDKGPATSASLKNPVGVHVDAAGNLYISDEFNARIRKVTNGIIDSVAANPSLGGPQAVDLDAAGNLYVADIGFVKKISPQGVTTIIAGTSPAGFSGDGGPATRAQLNFASALALDGSGNVLIVDILNRRLRIVSNGVINTLAGNGLFRFTPDGTPATLAFLKSTYGVAVGPNGQIYVADRDDARIRRIDRDGTINTAAGNGLNQFSGTGSIPAASPISFPVAPAVDSSGNLYFIEADVVRKVTIDGRMSTVAGGGTAIPGDGGKATSARLELPQGLAVDAKGNLYIGDDGTFQVRKVTPDGTISTIAGNGTSGFSGDGGLAIKAQLAYPLNIAVDSAGVVYFCDSGRVRKIDLTGNISTYAGGGTKITDNIPATQWALAFCQGLALDGAGNLFIADGGRNVIRAVDANGIITTVAGNFQSGFSGDGGPAVKASLEDPNGIALDSAGNLYIGDLLNYRIRVVRPPPAGFSISTSTLSFTVQSGGASPPPQQVSISSSVSGLPYTVTVATTSGGNWLSTSASSAVMQATLNVTVIHGALSPNTYQGTITITPGVAGLAPQTVNVTFIVKAGIPSLLSTDSTGINFTVVRGSAPAVKRILALDSGGGSVDFTVSAQTKTGGNWLSVTPAKGTATAAAPVSLTVTADPTGLTPNTYTGTVTIADADGETTLIVPVAMTVSASGQAIRLSQVGLTFTAVVGGGAAPPQNVVVLNTGSGAYQFSATAITASGIPKWLSVNPPGGTSDSSQPFPVITVSVNSAGLTAGDYYGRVEIQSRSADNSPQDAVVVLHLLAAGTATTPVVQPAGLVFTGVAGGGDPSSQTVTVTNLTAAALSFGSSVATLDGGKYIVYQPVNTSVPPGSVQLIVQPSFQGLAAGVYRGAIVLIFSDGSIETVGILIVLAPAGTKFAGAEHAVSGCSPKQLLPLVTSLGSNFSVPASFPASISAHVVDDCGAPLTAGSVVASFSNGDSPVPLVALGNGDWSATWTDRHPDQRNVTITTTAELPSQQLQGSAILSGSLTGSASPPLIAPGGILSASSFALQMPGAPGAMVSVFGVRLANGSAPAPSLPLGNQLAGTSLALGGLSMPLLYSSDGQVNALVPFGTPINVPVQVIATNGSQLSVPEEVLIAGAQPGVFTVDGSGKNQGHIYIAKADGTATLAGPASPAKAGDVLVMYCAGLGPVNVPVVDGTASPFSPIAFTTNQVTVTIGGINAPVAFSGLTPGFAGLYQINAVVPAGVKPGDQVQVIVTVANQSSPPVAMSVR